MKHYLILCCWLLATFFCTAQAPDAATVQRWQQQAQRVQIIRDNIGIPHIYGKTDADAVFGLLYAQCEDDFPRVELNYIEKLGRMAELKGETYLYEDLLIRLIIDEDAAKKDYHRAPKWLKELCNAFADGINYYLYKNPQRKPALLTTFEPWYPLLWTDGSIGAISTADITVKELAQFYGNENAIVRSAPPVFEEPLPTGSNGFAIAPSKSASGNAMLFINPHVTFYFRPEVHMVSEQGLNAYGAVTWGQFFIYQGFNEKAGWMHTSCYVDAADTYVEKLEERKYGWTYEYEGKLKPVKTKPVAVKYKTDTGFNTKHINTFFTHHGPIMARRQNQYLSMRADNRLMDGLIQCWQRTKVNGLTDFTKTLNLRGNISNSTVYADAQGNIAYWHGNRIPKRDPSIDWTKPVDGSVKKTEWQGYHPINETVHMVNPDNGWLQHCNSSAFRIAGENSPKASSYPVYMAPDGDNFRSINAVRTLEEADKLNLDDLIKVGYNRRLAAFEELIPALVKSFDEQVNPSDSLYAWLAGPVAVLRAWNKTADAQSVAVSLAVEWGQQLLPSLLKITLPNGQVPDQVERIRLYCKAGNQREMLMALYTAVNNLQQRYGKWQIAWGEINRLQRISPAIDMEFDDAKPSEPVPFVSGTWGMLPSYNSRTFKGTTKRYGIHGNSFVCAVEFGPKVKAKALLAGGQSGDPASPHFADQVTSYANGQFRDVYFYKEDVLAHAEKTYHPGE